ncbi:putative subtilisin inhibitor protein [Actinoplanes missouriensis 431]|uniref:Putative subtilisin inhibitor protein n=1 Tax=Actinoplanes missouriensis (strain ATCC 14538 / DSM 43046 / CBS 188.64 / JCM 3121 / NBRC 102363 / NCIMB 12654 / NRRL B-3342 / UNCC 431) TaxID=512565 RepID=I0H136_ACTM4|nr:SSI family serine proteinase inhibitor [Actinoplanes missouriensis]BAL86723.1 putative subtilisin inhibitor protein [Actinoplanes missouriensis 431]
MIRTLIAFLAAGIALAGGKPGGDLTLTYMADAGFASAVKLTCDPDSGGHPKTAEACATLRTIDADPDRLPAGDKLCILLYQPVTAEITGVWRGRQVSWRHTYGNTCEMNRATGVLFRF